MKKLHFSLIAALILVLSGANSALAAGSGVLKITNTGAQTYNVGDTVTVDVKFDTSGTALQAAQAVVNYNATIISTDASKVNFGSTPLDLRLPVVVENNQIKFSAAKSGSGYTGDGVMFASISFVAQAEGAVTLSFDSSSSLLVDTNGEDFLGTTQNAAITVGSGQTPPDTTPPVVSSPSVTDETQNSAKVSWTTNEATTGKVEYGTTTSYGSEVADSTLATTHSVTLTGLSPDTTYYYRITAVDGSTNSGSSQSLTFATEAGSGTPTNNTTTNNTVTNTTTNNTVANTTTNNTTANTTTNNAVTNTTGSTNNPFGDGPLVAPITGPGEVVAVVVAILAGVVAVVLYVLYARKRDKKKHEQNQVQGFDQPKDPGTGQPQ